MRVAYQHQIRRGLADLGARQHQAEVRRLEMSPAGLKAVLSRRSEARYMAA